MSEHRWQDIWIEQCEAAEDIMHGFGVESAFDYIVGEKLVTLRASGCGTSRVRAARCPVSCRGCGACSQPEEMQDNFARFEQLLRDMEKGRCTRARTEHP